MVLGDNHVYRCVNEVADVVLGATAAAIALDERQTTVTSSVGRAADHSDQQ